MSGRSTRIVALTYVSLGLLQRSLAVLLLPLVSRVLTPSEFGVVATVVVTASALNVVLAAPVELGLFRAVASTRNAFPGVERISRIYLCFLLPILGAVTCLVLWSLGVVEETDTLRLWMIEIVAASLAAAASSYGLVVSRASDRLRHFAIISLTSSVSLVAGKIMLVVIFQYGALGWVLADLIAAAIGWFVVFALVVRTRVRIESRGVDGVRTTWKAALAIFPHRLAFWSLSSLSRPLVAVMFTSADAGYYAMAYSLATVATLVLGEVNNATLVTYVRDAEGGGSRSTRSTMSMQGIAALVLPSSGGVLIWLSAPVLLDRSYYQSIELFGMMVLGQAAYGFYVIPMNLVIHRAGRPSWGSLASVLGAVTTVLVIVLASRFDDLLVAAASSSAGFGVMALVAGVLAVNLRCIPTLQYNKSVAIAYLGGGVAMALAIWVLIQPVGSRTGLPVALAVLGVAGCSVVLSGHLRRRRPSDG